MVFNSVKSFLRFLSNLIKKIFIFFLLYFSELEIIFNKIENKFFLKENTPLHLSGRKQHTSNRQANKNYNNNYNKNYGNNFFNFRISHSKQNLHS